MNKTFEQREIDNVTFNILALPDTNLFKFEYVCMIGSNIERVIEKHHAKDLYGISHFIEHLGFRAPRDFTTNALMKLLRTRGQHNASTSHDRINYWFKTDGEHRNLAIDLVCNYSFNDLTNISQEEFDIEKKVVFNEIKRYADDDQTMFYFDTLSEVCGYHKHDNILGNADVFNGVTLEDAIYIKNIMLNQVDPLFNITYDPAVDNIDEIIAEVMTQYKSHMDEIDVNDYDEMMDDYTELLVVPEMGRHHTLENESKQAMTTLLFDCIGNFKTAALAHSYLARYAPDTSLNDIIREDHGLTYGVDLYPKTIGYVDYMAFGCDVSRGDEQKLLELFAESINKSVDEFDKAKYNDMMDAVRLKRTMAFLNQNVHDDLFWKVLWHPDDMDMIEDELKENIMTAYDKLDDVFGTFEQIRDYLQLVKKQVNEKRYTTIVN